MFKIKTFQPKITLLACVSESFIFIMAAAMEFSEIKSYCKQYKEKFGFNFFSIFATINGYHHYKVRPLIGFEMILQCIREPENRHDNNRIMQSRLGSLYYVNCKCVL